jgi:hypothetical protein
MTRVVDELMLLGVVATRFSMAELTKDEKLIRAFQHRDSTNPVTIMEKRR